MTRLFLGLLLVPLVGCEVKPLSTISVPRMASFQVPLWPLGQPSDSPSSEVLPSASALDSYQVKTKPEDLQVYRSTSVELSLRTPEGALPPSDAICLWNLGDGSTPRKGCEIEHTFIGGSADERFSVSLEIAGQTRDFHHILPLERLPVTRIQVTADSIPTAPSGDQSFRAIFIADTQTLDEDDLRILAGRIQALEPALVFHLGGLSDEESTTEAHALFRTRLMEPLRAAGIPLVLSPSPEDLTHGLELRPPLNAKGEPLELIGAEHYPERFAFAFKGVFFALLSGSDQEKEGLQWLRTRLGEAQIYTSRLVFSYLPLHPFSVENSGPLLGPKFKVYETLLRSRVTALITAGHQTYFKGRYGALSVLSVGSPGQGGRLIGNNQPQAPSFAVMDVKAGIPSDIFALTSEGGEPFAQPFDESYLPDTVEVYTR